MIEKILFGHLVMPGEFIRILIAFLGLLITSYFDIFNNKNIPEKLLYLFLAAALIVNFYFYDPDLSLFALGIAFAIGVIGYGFHKMGQIGMADVYVLSSIALLLPIHPSFSNMVFNFPFVLSVLIFSGVFFALYTIINFSIKLIKKKKTKPNYIAFAILIPYAIFLYMFFQFPFFSQAYFAVVSIVVLSSIFFYMFKEDINEMLIEKVPLNKVENEDVVALEKMDQKLVQKYKISRVVDEKELKRLKKFKIKSLWIFTQLPPFLPFILIGFVASLFYSNLLLG